MFKLSSIVTAVAMAVGLLPGTGSAQMLLFPAVPDSAEMLSAEEIYQLYANTSEDWGGGSYAFRSTDGTFRAVNTAEGSLGMGEWYITTSGKMCYRATWYWRQDFGVKDRKVLSCSRFARDEAGDIWAKDVSQNGPWLPLYTEGLTPGESNAAGFEATMKTLGLNG